MATDTLSEVKGHGYSGRRIGPNALPHQFPVPLNGLRQRFDAAREAVSGVIGAVTNSRNSSSSAVKIPKGRVYTSPLRNGKFAAIIPGDSVVEQVITSGISQTLSLYNAALIGRIILTWFPNPPLALLSPLSTVCDPYLNLFRGLIPPIGGTIDLSPILAFVVLDLFSNSAAALPCEIGPDGQPVTAEPSGLWTPAKGLRAWEARMRATRLRRKEEAEKQGSEDAQS
uniref:YggT family protein n=1 Tax=Tetraselmis sp. GSL018 TaxID=582737 RepID=A0A061S6R8_9CHLO|eukprot:CAMPEP_0177601876 /NCGR_PEP_ID=MMETSP0419_2-20121207/14526_1 /TAXON_ID=582737 /ORGANISM="Tetraselmis sp., Strain GSL018" /LENGTH=226 /DNA_ID=CAMNT_0019095237 /DNA_START=115 /DNA_END=795 /DNA_ORIENTATION=-